MKKIFLVFVCMFLSASFAYSGINVSGTVKDYGSENTISGATIGITGTKITATSGTGGNFTLQNVPYDSFVVELKASKSGYKTTYTMPTGFGERDEAGFNIMLFSNTFYNNNLHGGNAPSHTPGKGDIAGLVHRIGEAGGDIPIDGVAITAKYLDTGGQIPSTQIKYLNSSGSGFIDSSTSSQGIFIIYNVDPGRGVKITASKSGTAFNSPIAICYADCITMGDVQVTGGNITIGGYVGDENENPVNGATVSILGTGTSATTNSKGEFTFSNTYDFSPGVIKLSKTNYKDTYFVGFISSEDEEEDEGGIELTIISTNIYNELLSQLGVSHTTGKGDIIGCVGEDYDISGAEVKVYDENGDEVNANIYYFNEDGQPDASLTKTTSDSNFLILNLTPGFYYITAVKENFEFQLVGIPVFANGITMEDELIDWPPIQSLEKQAPSMQIQETEITSSATDVSILKFNLLASYPELFNSYFQEQKDVKIESIKFKIDGTGDVSTCISSAKLYYSDPWSESNYTFAGIATSITKNEILFTNLNVFVGPEHGNNNWLLKFDFNGQAEVGKTFRASILKNSDIVSNDGGILGAGKVREVTCYGDPIIGNYITIKASPPPAKPTNIYPANEATEIAPDSYSLQSSSFIPGEGNITHTGSQWQIRKNGETYETSTFDSGRDTTHLTSYSTPVVLEGNTTYWWRVRYQNGDGAWSEWSDETFFTTSAGGITPPNTPENTSPDNEATEIEPNNCILKSSEFSQGSSSTHTASQWQITNTSGNYSSPVFDSGRDTENLTQITIPAGILHYNTTYWWHVRYQDGNGAWSDWSEEKSFTTKEVQPGNINGDEGIDISDVILVLRMALGLPVTIQGVTYTSYPDSLVNCANINGDEGIDISDVILVLRMALGLPITINGQTYYFPYDGL